MDSLPLAILPVCIVTPGWTKNALCTLTQTHFYFPHCKTYHVKYHVATNPLSQCSRDHFLLLWTFVLHKESCICLLFLTHSLDDNSLEENLRCELKSIEDNTYIALLNGFYGCQILSSTYFVDSMASSLWYKCKQLENLTEKYFDDWVHTCSIQFCTVKFHHMVAGVECSVFSVRNKQTASLKTGIGCFDFFCIPIFFYFLLNVRNLWNFFRFHEIHFHL